MPDTTRKPRPRAAIQADARMLAKIWRSRARQARRDGNAHEYARCVAAEDRFLSDAAERAK